MKTWRICASYGSCDAIEVDTYGFVAGFLDGRERHVLVHIASHCEDGVDPILWTGFRHS